MFDEAQIQEFKEAFNLIDQNHDGYIDEADLREMFSSLGKLARDEYAAWRGSI
jgi:Ca2+-binding EF-hand superfamily protein